MTTTLAEIFNLSIQIFVLSSMLKVGLSVTVKDIITPFRSHVFTLQLLVLNFVAMPLIAVAIVFILGLSTELAIGLFLVSVCAGGPMLAKYADLAKGDLAMAAGSMVFLQALTIVFAPMLLEIMPYGHGTINVDALAIFKILVTTMLFPLAAGIVLRSRYKDLSDTLCYLATHISTAAIVVSLIIGFTLAYDELFRLVGTRAFLASASLVFAGLLIGWHVTRGEHRRRVVMSLGVASRSDAAALLIASQSFPQGRTMVMVLAFALVMAVINMLISAEMGRRDTPVIN